MPLLWLSVAIFFVYAGIEVTAGQWAFSLFTESRGLSTTTAGIWVSVYWASLTVGRILFGVVVNHVSVDSLLRACMLAAIVASGLIWLNVQAFLSLSGLAVIGLVLAPMFPSLIATTPARLGERHTADAVGWEVGAAVLGGALLPGAVGVLAARLGLEVVGPCLVVAACALFGLHEMLVRLSPASEPRRSARSRTDAVASPQQGA